MRSRILLYVFPVFLVGLEYIFRASISTSEGSGSFLGPTLAAAGVGLILPLIILQSPVLASDEIKQKYGEVVLINKRDRAIAEISLVFVFVCTAIWLYSLSLSCEKKDVLWWILPCHIYPGLFNYGIGVILTEIKG
jgi:hypothetical protein